MKETTKMSRAICQLEKMYNTLNEDFFQGSLPVPIITIQSKPGTWGHCSRGKIWKRKEEEAYEMNIAAEVANGEIEEIIDTILHEMIHLYCRENQIQEVSRGGTYHNRKFKELAEECGLKCYITDKYGWNTRGHDNNTLTEYAIEKGWSELKIGRSVQRTPQTQTVGTFAVVPIGAQQGNTPTNSSSRKYQCPKCKNSVRATKAVNIICGDCNETMILIR